MHQAAKFLIFASISCAAGVGLVALVAPGKADSVKACEDVKSESVAPGGKFKEEMVVHTCGWGFGLAAETVDLKVTKLGKDGWYSHVPIEFDSTAEDQGLPTPIAQWTGPSALQVTIKSRDRVGTLVSRNLGLTVTRTYEAP